MQVKLNQLKRVALIDEITVSSDSEAMLELARHEGVCGVCRPDEYCDEKSRTFNHVVSYIATNEVKSDSYFGPRVYARLSGRIAFIR